MKISVIVPIYNKESLLSHCVDSLIPNCHEDYELILVDDGSKDGSGRLLDEYASKNTHIKVIHKPNGGVSSARNAGLKTATGEYITFVDPDDFVEVGYIDSYVTLCEQHHADLVVGGVKEKILGENENIIDFKYDDYYIEDVNTAVSQKYIQESNLLKSCFLHAKILKRSIIEKNDLTLKPVSSTEDTIFMFEYLQHVQSIQFSSYQGYNYIIYPLAQASLSRTMPPYQMSLQISDYLYDIYPNLFAKYNHIDKDYRNRLVSEYGIDARIVALLDVYINKRLIKEERVALLKKERCVYRQWADQYTHVARRWKQGLVFKLVKSIIPIRLFDFTINLLYKK